MTKPISSYQMGRRQLLVRAKGKMLEAMQQFTEETELSGIEWITVFYEIQENLLTAARINEWRQE